MGVVAIQATPTPPLTMSGLVPYTSAYGRYGYGYPYAGVPAYGAGYYGGYGAAYGAGYPYGPYGMTAEEIQKVREAEEKAFNDAETKRKEFMEAEKKKYEEFVAAEKKKYEDYVSAQKKAVEDAITKEKELAEKLGPYAYGPYGAAGPFGYGYGYPYGGAAGYGGYGYGYPGGFAGYRGYPY